MPERRVDPESGNPRRFNVPVDSSKMSNFPDQKPVWVILPDESVNVFDVFQKDIPGEARQSQYNGKPIHWMNNFGLKQKGQADFQDAVPAYTIQLEAVDGAVYVYFDGVRAQPLSTRPSSADPQKVEATLTLGDPATGWVK